VGAQGNQLVGRRDPPGQGWEVVGVAGAVGAFVDRRQPLAQGRAGGSILLIEPDFLLVSVAELPELRAFWNGWLAWAREQGVWFLAHCADPRWSTQTMAFTAVHARAPGGPES
jgi:hypothetical protein